MSKIFGERLRYELDTQGIYQKDLASYIDKTQTSISRYIKGDREPDFNTLLKIAEYLNVSVDYLVGAVDNKTPNKHNKGIEVIKSLIKAGVIDPNQELTEDAKKNIIEITKTIAQIVESK